MVRRVRLDEVAETSRGLPVEFAAVDDDPADRGSVATDILGGRLDHDVGSPLDGPGQNRGRGSIVDHEWHALLVGDVGQPFNVDDVELGIAHGLGVDGPRLLVDCGAQAVKIIRVDKADVDAQLRQGVVEEVVGPAIERSGGDDLVAGAGERQNGQGFGGLSGGGCQRGCAPFERGEALFEDIGRRVHDAGIDVAEFL